MLWKIIEPEMKEITRLKKRKKYKDVAFIYIAQDSNTVTCS
jgi:hypothetical protein